MGVGETISVELRNLVAARANGLSEYCHHRRRLNAVAVVRISLRHDRSHLHDLEVRSFDRAKRVQIVVAPARIGRAADVPVRSVVRDNHSVLFQRAQNHLHL